MKAASLGCQGLVSRLTQLSCPFLAACATLQLARLSFLVAERHATPTANMAPPVEVMKTISPVDGSVVCEIPLATPDEVRTDLGSR